MIHVVVAVIRDANGQVLLTRRQAHQDFALHWEFPGGKVEPGESMLQALQRELQEELGIELLKAELMMEIPWQYPHKTVCLSCFAVTQWTGEPEGLESQMFAWFDVNSLTELTMPAANAELVSALCTRSRKT